MKEELFISGRNLPGIDPVLDLWHWEIAIYLFLGGLAAGILFFSALYTILGKADELPAAVKWASFLAPLALVVGLGALFLDLSHKLYFWRLYTTVKFQSPMSWGAWILLGITPLSFAWSMSYIKDIFPSWDWKFDILNRFEEWFIRNRQLIAWPLISMALILGIYTGILLSAFNARPLWNNAILGPLFLVSGLSTGAAVIMWMSKSKYERTLFSKIDLGLIAVELFFIIHLFMGYLAGSEVQVQAVALFVSGHYAIPFWGLVVGVGLVIPAVLEILELRGRKIPVMIPALCILIGGLILRFIILEAGQITRYLY